MLSSWKSCRRYSVVDPFLDLERRNFVRNALKPWLGSGVLQMLTPSSHSHVGGSSAASQAASTEAAGKFSDSTVDFVYLDLHHGQDELAQVNTRSRADVTGVYPKPCALTAH